MQTIYLDHNATTPVDPSVIESMKPALSQFFGNPSSAHLPGLEARKLVEEARNQVARLINCRPEEIVFTSGGTESNNHAIKGIAYGRPGGHIITSNIEHPARVKQPGYITALTIEFNILPKGWIGNYPSEFGFWGMCSLWLSSLK